MALFLACLFRFWSCFGLMRVSLEGALALGDPTYFACLPRFYFLCFCFFYTYSVFTVRYVSRVMDQFPESLWHLWGMTHRGQEGVWGGRLGFSILWWYRMHLRFTAWSWVNKKEPVKFASCKVSGSLLLVREQQSCLSSGNCLFITGTTKSLWHEQSVPYINVLSH